MNDTLNKKPIQEEILEEIKRRHIAMRPRWKFVLQAVMCVVGVIILILALLYLGSFIIFSLRKTGAWFVPAFGFQGWYRFVTSLPWLLVFFSIIFVAILEVLVRRYSFAYRRPIFYSVLGIVAFVIVGGFLISRTPLHGSLFKYVEKHRTPIIAPFYRGFGERRPGGIYPGTVREIRKQGFLLQDRRGVMIPILITPATRLPFDRSFLIGDLVLVLGELRGDVLEAFGIRKISE
jgi:hypothetical protein